MGFSIPQVFGFVNLDETNEINPAQVGLNVGGYIYSIGVIAIATGVIQSAAKLIPLIGVIAGLARISFAAEMKENGNLEDYEVKAINGHIIRGILEVCCLGSILLIVDIVAATIQITKNCLEKRS